MNVVAEPITIKSIPKFSPNHYAVSIHKIAKHCQAFTIAITDEINLAVQYNQAVDDEI
ncbi:hypothetical protein HYC85_001393 [Camellia sinensis]|uniref:Uncharacterized protein n=1 Tax=Camellia sinensis TaxID=4442 RepID=A0A7J7I727_CAMSI|nr:hypothetical protein HYC85_001393 [Camellia sinensis]